jgi:hypothetical protein
VRSQLNAKTLGGNTYLRLMFEQIDVVSSLAPSEVLDRLTRYGVEWRESKIPLNSRRSFYGCRISVRGDEFELQLDPQGRSPVIWQGQVLPESSTSGSRILTRVKRGRWSTIFSIIVVVFLFASWATSQLFGAGLSVARAVLAIAGTCIVLIVAIAVASARAKEQSQACRAIFAQILGTS